MLATLSLYTVRFKESPEGCFLSNVPFGRFGRSFLSDVPFGRVWRRVLSDVPFGLVGEKKLFGRCRHQLILAALLLYPFGIKEGPKRHVLSRVPLNGFCQDSPAPLLFRRFWDPWASWIGF